MMNIGAFMKYYRIFMGMTQKQVGEGICTPGHISKIESGHLHLTKDKLDLFNRKLQINIEKEMQAYKKLQTELDLWHDVMIKQVNGKVELLNETIEQNPLVKIETLNGTYKLLRARYLMFKGNLQESEFLLNQFSNKRLSFYMTDYDYQLYYHIKGMFELLMGNAKKAVGLLGKIDGEIYTNYEFYYHLALAHQELDQIDQSLHYSELALHHFKETFNFTRCLDAATIQLAAEGRMEDVLPDSLIWKYDELIQHCDHLHDHRRKAILYLNLGNAYRDVMDYKKAREAFQAAYGLLKHESHWAHINSLFGYIDSSLDEDPSASKDKFSSLIDEGLDYSRKVKDSYKETLFTMLKIRVHEGDGGYYQYIENVIIPLLKEERKFSQCKYYIQKLYTHGHCSNGMHERECVLS